MAHGFHPHVVAPQQTGTMEERTLQSHGDFSGAGVTSSDGFDAWMHPMLWLH